MDILVSVILAIAIAAVTIIKKAFTVPAALTACAILVTVAVCGSWAGIFIVVVSYAIIFATDLIVGARSEKITADVNQRHGARGIIQVFANAFAATIAIVLSALLDIPELMLVYAAAITECLADSLASDVGVLSRKDPVDICRMKRIRRGLSGGVSLLGTLSAFLGCVAMFFISSIFFGISLRLAIAVILFPMIGIILDSILGSLVQAKYLCTVCAKPTEKTAHCGTSTKKVGGVRLINNDAVNIISNFLTAILAAVYVLFI